jgi:sulfur-oxidizing protein SoxA
MTWLDTALLWLFGILLAMPTAALSGEAKSGYEYVKPESRAIQDDDFANPGLIVVEQGGLLFNEKLPGAAKSCAECHGLHATTLDTKHIAGYPRYDEPTGEIVSLQKQISRCLTANSAGPELPADHADLIALETFVRHRAIGEAVSVQTDGAMTALLQKGEELFKTRYGLIDMACYHCHDLYPGQMIRGQKISQGQGNGFPSYRLDTGEVTSLSQRIQQCMTLMRAEPFDADSEEINLMLAYIMSRSNGLRIETPAVRY